MYGLINKGIEDMVIRRFGEDVWECVREKAGVRVEYFDSMTSYPDSVTYDLIGAASHVLNIPTNELLEAFGEYWILYTAHEGYGAMLETMSEGQGVLGLLSKLNHLHVLLQQLYTGLKAPVYRCTDVGPRSLRLQYRSERCGFAPMVVGLIKGLGVHFRTPVSVTQIRRKGDAGSDYDEFFVCLAA